MLRNQDITVPYGDTRIAEWDIDDVTGPDAGGPTNLLGKGVRWDLYKDNREIEPFYSLTDDGETLRISEPSNGIVTLHLDSEQTTLPLNSGRYYLRVTENDHRWTVATGKYTLTQ